jgi:hypothetical protein
MFDFYSFLDNTDFISCLYELFRLFNEAVSVTQIVNRRMELKEIMKG